MRRGRSEVGGKPKVVVVPDRVACDRVLAYRPLRVGEACMGVEGMAGRDVNQPDVRAGGPRDRVVGLHTPGIIAVTDAALTEAGDFLLSCHR